MSLLYRQAASTLRALEQKKKTVKSLVHQGDGNGEKKSQTLAIRCLQYKSVLSDILSDCNVDAEKLDIDHHMLYIQVYELLFGLGQIKGGGEVKRKLSPYVEALQLAKEAKMAGKSDVKHLLSKELQLAQDLPLYIRVNTCVVSIDEALVYLRQKLSGISVALDDLVDGLIVLQPGPEGLGSDEWVQEGRLVMQDKASCFPAQLLANHYFTEEVSKHDWRGDIIDACAAPGNKTSQLATFLHHQNQRHEQAVNSTSGKKNKKSTANSSTNTTSFRPSQVWAFDKSADRANMLQERMQSLHVEALVTVNNQDFLSVNVDDAIYSHVRNVLLDPSCSGSGIVRNAIDRIVERHQKQQSTKEQLEHDSLARLPATDQARVLKLQGFQLLALQKAMSFPQVQRVVYSTCSIHVEENEGVVGRLWQEAPPEITEYWRLVPPIGFDSWTRRGLTHPSILEKYHLTAEQAQCMIRCVPEDGMNGFFVAIFERIRPYTGPAIQLPMMRHVNGKQSTEEVNLTAHIELKESKKRKRSENEENSGSEFKSTKTTKLHHDDAAKKVVKPPAVVAKKEKVVGPNASTSFFGKVFIGSRTKKRFGRK